MKGRAYFLMDGRDFTALCNLTLEHAYNVNMVIEIDRKKVSKAKRDAWISSVAYVMIFLLYGWRGFDFLREGMITLAILYGVGILFWLMTAVILLQTCRRGLRHHRTEHHLFIDETGIAMVDGHARVDIPWGDVQDVSKKGFGTRGSIAQKQIKIQLRKESQYSKRTYRLYDDYELTFDRLYAHINEMWTARQAKPKLLTI